MAIVIDENDPCAAATALRAIYINLVAGAQAQDVRFRAGETGVEREVRFHKAEPARLLQLIREFEGRCSALSGAKPKRFAVRTGGLR